MKAKTEKIRVTVTTEEVKEIEISFPYYTRNNGLYCKFLSKDEAVLVSEYWSKRAIEYSNFATPENWLAYEPTTEEEFNEKFNEVMTALITFNNEKTI
jgi:cysteine synthase